ncbi:MAG: carboxypeptidase-like regulatory domain-containing protein [Patescibacteria group bacterium]|nr:carboxypeptidase-like regulatory domain-containing protein [Patescibacteria group bacterium]
MTLIDTVVGTALMLVVFMGIAAAFQLSLDVITNDKARGGAIALANERMEYIRALSYASIGTSGGIPAGDIAQTETVTLNNIPYTRRTLILYADDPADGLDAADTNSNPADYKAVKVEVSWTSRSGTRTIALTTRVDPPNGMEIACTPPCGTLAIAAVDSASAPLAGATVNIVNASVSPAVDLTTFTNVLGYAYLIGAPAGSGYSIVVSKPGYSTAQTYSVSAENTDPNPGNLTVSDGQTTVGTFAIDILGAKSVRTWTQILSGAWEDPFDGYSKIATSTNASVAGSEVSLDAGQSAGEVQSVAIAPIGLASWGEASWSASVPPDTLITYRIADADGTLIQDANLPGNSTGFTTPPIDLSGLSTTTYSAIRLDAEMSSSGAGLPSIDSWDVQYFYGPLPIPNMDFTLQGSKTIGSTVDGAVYKYSQTFNTGAGASVDITGLEWDTYSIGINGASTGYDIASSCAPQPEALAPGGSVITDIHLAAHTVNSLLVDVHEPDGTPLPGATVRLYKTGYDTTTASDSCGQAFFSGLTSSDSYSISVSAAGYTPYTSSSVSVGGTSGLSVTLN